MDTAAIPDAADAATAADTAAADRSDAPPASDHDAVVIGAGIGGLVAASLLARHGKRVVVVEQHVIAGGNATIFRRKGYEFDVGVHYVGECRPGGAIARVLAAAGVGDVAFEELDPDGYDVHVLPDGSFAVPRGVGRLERRLVEAFPAERRGIRRYASLLRQMRRLLAAWPRPGATAAALLRSPALLRWQHRSFADLLSSLTDDPALRVILAGQHVGYALPPSRASALVGLGIAAHYTRGAFYPRGGGQVISDRLVEAITERGGEVLLGCRARRVLTEGSRVTGVEVEGRRWGRRLLRAPVVVSNADLKHTLGELLGAPTGGGAARRDLRDRAGGLEMAPGLGVAYVGMARDLRAEGHPNRNYWVHTDLDLERAYAQAARGEQPDAPPLFVTIASLKDPTHDGLAPPGVTNVQAMGVAPSAPAAWGVDPGDGIGFADGAYRRSAAYREAKARYGESLLDGLQAVFPDVRARLDFLEVATPLTHSRYTGAQGGTGYGLAATPAQFGLRRPGPTTPVRGLLLCGASCRHGHGIHGAALSGLDAAARVLPGRLDAAVLA